MNIITTTTTIIISSIIVVAIAFVVHINILHHAVKVAKKFFFQVTVAPSHLPKIAEGHFF